MRSATVTSLASYALCLCVSGPAFCQVFDVSGGASTLYGAEGASVAIHGANSETAIGAGLINGHFGLGASSTRNFHGGLLTAGQQSVSMELPTDIFGGGPILSGLGFGYHSMPGKARQISGFVGSSSAEGGTPLFQSSHLKSPAAYIQVRQPLTSSLTSISTAVFTTQTGSSFLQGFSWTASRSVLCGFTGGVGGGDPYAAASIVIKTHKLELDASYVLLGDRFQRGTNANIALSEPARENISAEYHLTRSVILSGLHRNYITPVVAGDGTTYNEVSSGPLIRSSLDEAAIQYRRTATVFSFTMLRSHSEQPASDVSPAFLSNNSGLSAGFTHKVGSVEWNESFYRSVSDGGMRNAFLVSSLAMTLNPHLRLTESVTESANGPSFSHGGSLITRFSSVEVDYQLLYLATRPDHPFQQAMVFDSKIQIIRDLWLEATSSVGPTGATLYTFRMGKQFARTASEAIPLAGAAFGDKILTGRVIDETGAPVEGASLKIGPTEIYTDSKGTFFYREKTAQAHTLTVVLDDFMQTGNYCVLSAPASVRSAIDHDVRPLIVIVKRISEPDQPQDPKAGSASPSRRPLPAAREVPR